MRETQHDAKPKSGKLRLFMLCVLAVAVFIQIRSATAEQLNAASPFIKTSGTNFELAGKRFRVAGVNNHYLTYGSHKEVTRVLDDAVAMNANVVRVFVSPIIGSEDGRVKNVFDIHSGLDSSNLGTRGVYMASFDPETNSMRINEDANGLARVDFLISEASKRNLRIIVAFLDYWAYTGGSRQIAAWYGNNGDDQFFAQDPRTRADYKRFVSAIVTRVNTLSGLAYKDDPTIFAWELMNEPEIQPVSLFKSWAAEMAAYVKTLDHNHMLASGQSSIRTKLVELSIPEMDFGTWHGYPAYLNLSPEQFDSVIGEYCDLAASYGKPVVLEEFGVPASNPDRPKIYQKWLQIIDDNPACGGGWLVWRLVSRQDNDEFPLDVYDKFDIHNDGSPVWLVLKNAASKFVSD